MRAYLVLVLLLLVGCESWIARPAETETKARSKPRFNSLRMTPDTVVLEVAVAKVARKDMAWLDDLWHEMDTSAIAIKHRKLLDQNGLRAGLVSDHIPSMLQQILAPKPIVIEELNDLEKQLHEKGMLQPEPVYLLHDGIQNRSGEVHPVPVSQTIPEKSWLVKAGGKTIAGAGTMVRGFIEVETFPKGDGTVRLVCTPALHLGEPKTQIGVKQNSFVYETAQDKQLLRELKFDICLRNGESLIVGPTSDLQDLGQLFFGSTSMLETKDQSESDDSIRIMLVRLMQTQMDDLFDPEAIRDKLSTTSFE